MESLDIAIIASYVLVLVVLSVYGSHRYWMAYLYYRHKFALPTPRARFDRLPRVTIQLPVFNEMYVVRRLVDAVCRLDWPADLLEVQVLDDSTDETCEIARAAVDRWREAGVDVVYIHRRNRQGFKAGALAAGLAEAKGEFVAVFDADFVPEPDFLRRTVHFFTDPEVGMVQVRWEHLNRDYSALTRAQGILLDAHFVIEHTARNRSGAFFNFNGTAGVWRRSAVEGAGGWQHDTLTEDLDLSYRAQLRGWRFVFLQQVVAPAEIPVEMNAFKTQQHRWAKGSIQTAMKLLPGLLRSHLPWHVKREAFFHLTANFAYLMMIPLALLMPLSVMVRMGHGSIEVLLLDVPIFVAATLSVGVFYVSSQREIGMGHWERVKYLPFIMALGIGLSVNNARAVVEALMGHRSSFARTPKHGVQAPGESVARRRYRATLGLQPFVELGLAVYVTYGIAFVVEKGVYYSLPFLVLFQVGFGYVGLMSLVEGVRDLAAKLRIQAPRRADVDA
ncbi:MAG TPA: cellulose synthase family protein [Anaeromyxobacteraceae bacterium]|jgi:cellulose synthase/poly-beta-1,6-N-acetylglucosamine synthase-like glycosyltransferase